MRFSWFKNSVRSFGFEIGPVDYGLEYGLLLRLGYYHLYWIWWKRN